MHPTKTRDHDYITTPPHAGKLTHIVRDTIRIDLVILHHGRTGAQAKEDQFSRSRETIESPSETTTEAIFCVAYESESGAELSQSSTNRTIVTPQTE